MAEGAEALISAFDRGAPVRVLNFHATPAHRAAEYDRQLGELAERFSPCREEDLLRFLETGAWPGRPGVVVALYNGYRDNWDVLRPLLDRHRLVGWFFAVTGWTGCPAAGQVAFARAHGIGLVEGEYADGRHALSWEELRALDREGHVVASHTRTHTRVTDAARLRDEVVGSQEDFVRHLGHPVRALAWLGGAPLRESPEADALVREAGYRLLFSNPKGAAAVGCALARIAWLLGEQHGA
jgi:peptidoglycan/xylan/chitin deacetylase (PgdA/CDA1 family)